MEPRDQHVRLQVTSRLHIVTISPISVCCCFWLALLGIGLPLDIFLSGIRRWKLTAFISFSHLSLNSLARFSFYLLFWPCTLLQPKPATQACPCNACQWRASGTVIQTRSTTITCHTSYTYICHFDHALGRSILLSVLLRCTCPGGTLGSPVTWHTSHSSGRQTTAQGPLLLPYTSVV